MQVISKIKNSISGVSTLLANRGAVGTLTTVVGTGWKKTVRRILPAYEYPRINGVRVSSEQRRRHLLDRWVPWPTPWNPGWEVNFDEYKQNAAILIQDYIRSGDDVCIVGGGYGVSTILTAEEVGEAGTVTVYEAAKERYETLTETIKLNEADNVDCKHALVGPDVSVAGAAEEATIIEPTDLPEVDVLELDCEGAELSIIESLSVRPRIIIVETHPEQRTTTAQVKEALMRASYRIDTELDDPVAGSVLAGKKAT